MATRMTTHRLPKVRSVRIAVTTTGVAGSATGNTTSEAIVGQVLAVYVNWHASAPAGTSDIVVEGATSGVDLYAKLNAVTDVAKVPSLYGLDNASVALTGDVTPQRYCIAEGVKVTVSQSDALTNCAVVTIVYRPLYAEVINVTTAGVAGSATGNTTSNPIRGEILGILINYHASAPAGTTDIVIEMATSGIDLYAKVNTVTDTFVVPVLFSVNNANAALTSDVTPRHYCVADRVKVTINQSDALTDAVIVTVFWAPLDVVRIAVTTTGAAGSASGNSSAQVEGEVVGLAANFHASAPNTTDIDAEGLDTGLDIWQRSNSEVDAFVVPGLFGVDNADAALTGNVTPEFYSLHDFVKVSLAQCDALTDAVIVDLFVRR
mgnify:CR=1 FL=1